MKFYIVPYLPHRIQKKLFHSEGLVWRSGVGIFSLLTGTTDIAQASRSIKFSEKQKFKADGKNVVEVIVANYL